MNRFWGSQGRSRHDLVVNAVGLLVAGQLALTLVSPAHALSMFPVSEPLDSESSSPLPVTSERSEDSSPLRITAERTEFNQVTEEFKAVGSVVVTQGVVRLTADQAILHKLSGRLTATGHVHLKDQVNDVWAEELTINVNTESVLVVNGKIFLKETGTWLRGRLLQRFSETHYRVKDGTFTNCEADDGQIPDWSFSFQDIDVEQGDSVSANNAWLNVRNQPIVPIPALRYPMPGARKTGFLVPTIGYDNVLGVQYRQGFYWAISPAQDLTIAPQILSKRGQGGGVTYRYVLNRRSRGRWLLNAFNDTKVDQARAQITGAHVHHVQDDLLIQANVNYATDRRLLRDLSASGISRALPSQESVLNVTRRLPGGAAYLRAQYLQPLDSGGRGTFQRLPEIGHRYGRRFTVGAETFSLDVGLDSTFVHFAREEGFNVSRFDVMPTLAVRGLHLGHMIGLRPQFKFREVFYSRGRVQDDARDRGTYWLGLEAVSNVSRAFQVGTGHRLRHTVEPRLFYEYVPATGQSDLPQIDATDNLLRKHLVTYSLRTRLQDEWSGKSSATLVDVMIAQSYHLADTPGSANTLSDLWGKATFELPGRQLPGGVSRLSLSLDTFYDPGEHELTQFNSDLTIQAHRQAYVQLGHRYTRSGFIPRRGDIWNPVSFNEVLTAQSEINFFSAGGAVRLPLGWTVGTQAYHDFSTGRTPEWDVAGLYQNACQCWSLGLYYIRLSGGNGLPERNQFNFVLTLRGLGATTGLGTQLLKRILGPLLEDEPGVPWS
ncbi:MAG: LPS assembly protein LptD [Nitrospira sp.]|nr:LPS assembly protein LptD [Nitrospira sp.]